MPVTYLAVRFSYRLVVFAGQMLYLVWPFIADPDLITSGSAFPILMGRVPAVLLASLMLLPIDLLMLRWGWATLKKWREKRRQPCATNPIPRSPSTPASGTVDPFAL